MAVRPNSSSMRRSWLYFATRSVREGARTEILSDRDGVYRKLVYHNGRLAGALLYGDITGAGAYYRQYREGVN